MLNLFNNSYGFYSKIDPNCELINVISTSSRLSAAKYFAAKKQLDLKTFLKIYSVTR